MKLLWLYYLIKLCDACACSLSGSGQHVGSVVQLLALCVEFARHPALLMQNVWTGDSEMPWDVVLDLWHGQGFLCSLPTVYWRDSCPRSRWTELGETASQSSRGRTERQPKMFEKPLLWWPRATYLNHNDSKKAELRPACSGLVIFGLQVCGVRRVTVYSVFNQPVCT